MDAATGPLSVTPLMGNGCTLGEAQSVDEPEWASTAEEIHSTVIFSEVRAMSEFAAS